jgi:hypothetical protein
MKIFNTSLMIFVALSMLLVPVDINIDIDDVSISSSTVEARSRYRRYRDYAGGIWNRFVAQGLSASGTTAEQNSAGSASGGMSQSFGGTVVFPFLCTCGDSAGQYVFFQVPVKGVAGPYLVSPANIKSHGALFPGNHIIGTSNPGGTCGILIAWCFTFPVQQTVTMTPGMGTSLSP